MSRMPVFYVTSSQFKVEENKIFQDVCSLADGALVKDIFDFEIRSLPILETLEVRLEVMVQAEAANAYSQIKVPCVVEHAGLVFEDYLAESYPGGLTKPMWNTLGDSFIKETQSAGRRVLARAVVAYCDGLSVRTFIGETKGSVADAPRGSRSFYWDTVFMPDTTDPRFQGKTYAEIVENFGLSEKIRYFSQSAKAMLQFLEAYRTEGTPKLWRP